MKVVKFFGSFLAFCLSIIFFVFLAVFSTILFLKQTVKEEQIAKYIDSVDVFSIKANDILDNTYDNTVSLKDAIALKLKEKNIDENITKNILEGEELTNFIAKYSSLYINYLINNTDKPIVLKEDLEKVIDNNLIERSLNRSLTFNEKNELDKFITSTIKTINDELYDRDIFITNNAYDIYISFIMSDNFYIYCIMGLVILYVVLCIFCWSLYKPFNYLSIPCCLWGFILILGYLVIKIGIRFVIKVDGVAENLMKELISEVALNILIMGGITILVSVVLFILYKICKGIFYKEEEPDFSDDEDDRVNPIIKEKRLR